MYYYLCQILERKLSTQSSPNFMKSIYKHLIYNFMYNYIFMMFTFPTLYPCHPANPIDVLCSFLAPLVNQAYDIFPLEVSNSISTNLFV